MSSKVATEVRTLPVGERTAKHAPSESAMRDTARHQVVSSVIVPGILLLAYLAQCAWFIESQSFTFDEPINILSGLEQWRNGQFSGGQGMNDHPPLARMLCTLPAINSKFQIGDKTVPNPEAVAWHNSDFDSFGRVLPNPEELAWRTRPVNAVLGAVLGLLVWLAARSLYSLNAANFVLALFCFSPSIVAHFSLAATNDGVMTLMLFAGAFQLYRWYGNRSWQQTAVLGTVLGLLLLAKGSSLPFFVVAIVLMLALTQGSVAIRPTDWNWKQAGTAFLISFLIVWGAYHFHVSKVTLAASDVDARIVIPQRPDPVIRHSSRTFHISVPFPAFEFLQGFLYQVWHNKIGHSAFLLGRSYIGGSRLYFPVTILLKWPTIVLLLFLAAIGLMCLRRTSRPRYLALWAAFPVLYFIFAEFSNLNTGERYLLPIYPFALLLCGRVWPTKRTRGMVLFLAVALAVHVADALRYTPDSLSYFNLFVSPVSKYKLLSDSNLDWGQGLLALRRYQQAHPSVPIHLAYHGNVAPAIYGIQALPLMPNEHVSGTVIVSATYLSGQTLPDPNSYRWVLQYPLKLILNHSLYVFEVPNRTGPRP